MRVAHLHTTPISISNTRYEDTVILNKKEAGRLIACCQLPLSTNGLTPNNLIEKRFFVGNNFREKFTL